MARLYGSTKALVVFYASLMYVAKSGEVWCEGARIFMNPLSKHFNPLNAQRCLTFAVFFTPQYGDSFIEVRLEFHCHMQGIPSFHDHFRRAPDFWQDIKSLFLICDFIITGLSSHY